MGDVSREAAVPRGAVSNVGGTGLEDVVTMQKLQCDQKNARACTLTGAAEHGLGHKPAAAALLKQGCDLKDTWACALRKRLR